MFMTARDIFNFFELYNQQKKNDYNKFSISLTNARLNFDLVKDKIDKDEGTGKAHPH